MTLQIPSPNVAEGHQFKNASLMADLADAKVITEDELDSTTLKIAIEKLLGMLYLLHRIVAAVLLAFFISDNSLILKDSTELCFC